MPSRVVIARPLLPGCTQPLVDAGYDVVQLEGGDRATLLQALHDADALVATLRDPVDDDLLAASPSLRVVSNVAVGLDNVDLGAAERRGVVVCHTPGVLDDAVADLAMLLLLAVCRNLLDAVDVLRSGRWGGFDLRSDLGRDLAGMSLGLVGYGRIARAVEGRATAFGMHVSHHARNDTGAVGFVADLHDLLAASDAISLHVPLTEVTVQLLNQSRLALLPRGAVVVNTARGGILDEVALAEALEGGRLGGAGLDVFEGEPDVNPRLLAAPNVVLTPHVGSATHGTRRAMCDLAVAAVLAVLSGSPWDHVATGGGQAARG